jgi:hypothetical protein
MKNKMSLILLLILLFNRLSEAGPSTNRVPITTNLVFYLTGKQVNRPRSEFRSDELMFWGVACTSTHFIPFRTFSSSQAFDFTMVDAAGNKVKKNSRGIKMSQPFQPPTSRSEAARLPAQVTDGCYALFQAEDMFEMLTNGTYELEIRLRLWAQTTNQTPDYEIMTHFMNPPNANIHYGVVVSDLLRVKITKQE